MDKNKLWIIGALLVMVIIIGGGWALGIQPQLAAASTSQSQIATVNQNNANSQVTLLQLEKSYKNLPALQAELATLQQSIPNETAFPTFINQVDAIAASAGVTFTGWQFSQAEPYTPVNAPAPAAAAPASGSSSTSTPTPTATATPTPTTAPAPAATAGVAPYSNPAITTNNFVVIPATLNVTGTYPQTLAFVQQLQSGTRLFLVTGISITSTEGAGVYTATINGMIYVLPDAAATKK